MKIQKGEWKPRPQDIDAKSVGSDSETSVSESFDSDDLVSEDSSYCMYDDDQSESTDDDDVDEVSASDKGLLNPYKNRGSQQGSA